MGRRATDRERERTVSRLEEGYVAGALGTDTFGLRIGEAYRARSIGELRRLTADLPFGRLRDRIAHLLATVASAPYAPPVVRVAAPPAGTGPWTIGRSPACSLTLADKTVSRRHAELRRTPHGWAVRDLGSLNGTRVNGWRVAHARLEDGDELRLGDVVVQLTGR